MVYMCSSLLQWAPKTEKTMNVCKADQIHKITIIFIQNYNFVHPGQLIIFLEREKSQHPFAFEQKIS